MIDRQRWHVRMAAMPLALLVLVFVGCAKQSSTGQRAATGGDSGIGGAADGGAAGARSYRNGGGAAHGSAESSGGWQSSGGVVSGEDGQGGPSGAGRSRGRAGAAGGRGQGSDGDIDSDAADAGKDGATHVARNRGAGRSGRGGGAGGDGGAGYEDSYAAAMMGAARPSPAEFSEAPALADIHFDFDRYEIRSEEARALDANVEWLRANPKALLLIEGHCDERGTSEYNLALGDHRAKSALNYLVAHGIPGNRITVISYGEERPLCREQSEECWAQNRRSHFLVKSR